VNSKPESESIPEEEINLYDYWKVLVKRKKVFIGICLVPVAIATIISLSLPRYYRGESEIINPVIPPPNIVSLIGDIDDAKKVEIFKNTSDAIESVLISLPITSTDKINISIDAKTADIIPQAFKDLLDYIRDLPENKEEVTRIQRETELKTERISEDTDFKIKNLIEARKANLIFLNDLSDVIKKRKSPFVNINPADLIRKDGDLSLEIINLQREKRAMMKAKELNVKINVGRSGQVWITKQPSNKRIKQIIMITGLLSLFTGIFVIVLLEYIDRMKAGERSSGIPPQRKSRP
jgi:hypothetical protein